MINNRNSESYCKISMEGEFVSSLLNTTPHLSFNVTTHFDDGRTGLVSGEDHFCSWADVFQDDEDSSSFSSEPIVSVGRNRLNNEQLNGDTCELP